MIEEIIKPINIAIVTKAFRDYYKILDIKTVDKEILKLLKLNDTEFAYPITSDAADFWYNKKAKELILLKKDFAKNNKIDITDFIIFKGPEEKLLQKMNENEYVDEDIQNELAFEQLKEEKIRKLINKVFYVPNIFEFFMFIEYIDLAMYFASKQIWLDKDKEELFIEIIEKDDDELLEKFERFFNISLEIDQIRQKYKALFDLKDEFLYISYWDYENLDEAIKDISERENKFLEKIKEIDEYIEKNKDLYNEFRIKIKQKLKELKQKKSEG